MPIAHIFVPSKTHHVKNSFLGDPWFKTDLHSQSLSPRCTS